MEFGDEHYESAAAHATTTTRVRVLLTATPCEAPPVVQQATVSASTCRRNANVYPFSAVVRVEPRFVAAPIRHGAREADAVVKERAAHSLIGAPADADRQLANGEDALGAPPTNPTRAADPSPSDRPSSAFASVFTRLGKTLVVTSVVAGLFSSFTGHGVLQALDLDALWGHSRGPLAGRCHDSQQRVYVRRLVVGSGRPRGQGV